MMFLLSFVRASYGARPILSSTLLVLSLLLLPYQGNSQLLPVANFRLDSSSTVSRFGETVAGTDELGRYFGADQLNPTVAIGAPGEQFPLGNNVGAVYLTKLDGSNGTAGTNNTNLISYEGGAVSELYGSSLATFQGTTVTASSDILAIGAPGYRVGSQVFGKVDIKDPFGVGYGAGPWETSIVGPTVNGGFGKYLSAPTRAIWSQARGPLPELFVAAITEKKLYILNPSNGPAGLNTNKYASFPTTIPSNMAVPSSMFGAKVVAVDITGDPTVDLLVCDPTARLNLSSPPNGVAYIYDGAAVTAYLDGIAPALHPTSQIAPDTTVLLQANNQSLRFCSDATVVNESSGSSVLVLGVAQTRPTNPSSQYYRGAIVAYKKDTNNTPTNIGTTFGDTDGVHFGYRVDLAGRSNIIVGAPKQTTVASALASVKVFDGSISGSPAGFLASFSSPILTRQQQTAGARATQEALLGQSLAASRNVPGAYSPILSAGSPANGVLQMAEGFSNPDFGFISVGGDNPLCATPGSIPSRLTGTREPITGDFTFSIEPQGAVYPFAIAIYFADPAISPPNLVLTGITDPNCTIPFLTGLLGLFPTSFTVPASAMQGLGLFAVGVVMEIPSGRILTTNALSFSDNLIP